MWESTNYSCMGAGRLTGSKSIMVVPKLVRARNGPFDMKCGPETTSKTDEYALSLDPRFLHLLGIQTVIDNATKIHHFNI